jgi:hypothetical protein
MLGCFLSGWLSETKEIDFESYKKFYIHLTKLFLAFAISILALWACSMIP